MMAEEFWAHQFHDNPKLLESEFVEDEEFDPDEVLARMSQPDDWEPVP